MAERARRPGILCTIPLETFDDEVEAYYRYNSYENVLLLAQSLLCAKYLSPTTELQINVRVRMTSLPSQPCTRRLICAVGTCALQATIDLVLDIIETGRRMNSSYSNLVVYNVR